MQVMMAMAGTEVVNQVSEAELVSNMLASNQENLINTMDVLEISDFSNVEENRSPVYQSDANEDVVVEDLEISDFSNAGKNRSSVYQSDANEDVVVEDLEISDFSNAGKNRSPVYQSDANEDVVVEDLEISDFSNAEKNRSPVYQSGANEDVVVEDLEISDFSNVEENRSPVYQSDANEDVVVEDLEISGEVVASEHALCNNKSPLEGDNSCNDNNNTCGEISARKQPLQPKNLFAQNENELQNYVRENFYTHTNEERNNPQQAGESCNNGDENTSNRNFDHFTSQDCDESRVNLPQFHSPDDGARQYAWGDNQQHYLRNEGYNSDSDVLQNSFRNKKSSLGNQTCETSPEFGNQFAKGHRRVKSGDVPAIDINVNNTMYRQFNSNQNNRPNFMQHSQSQGNLNMLQESRMPILNQSVSLDTPVLNSETHEHLCHQSTTFVALQAAIAEATQEYERLVLEVEAKFAELNAGLNVKQNPTHQDCQKLEKENKNLTKEIQDMYNQCDDLGVQVPGDPPPSFDNRRTSDISFSPYPVSPHVPAYPIAPNIPESPAPITLQPNSMRTRRANSNYENVIIDYSSQRKSDPLCFKPRSTTPPPIPPRLPIGMISMKPENEHWVCPQCTFNNLLVSDCEICLCPRPTTLR